MTGNGPADFSREIPNLAVGSWLARNGPRSRTRGARARRRRQAVGRSHVAAGGARVASWRRLVYGMQRLASAVTEVNVAPLNINDDVDEGPRESDGRRAVAEDATPTSGWKRSGAH